MLNENHPKCEEYREKFWALIEAFSRLEDEEKAKYPDFIGFEHPADVVLNPARRKLGADIRKLQEEYAELFTKESGE